MLRNPWVQSNIGIGPGVARREIARIAGITRSVPRRGSGFLPSPIDAASHAAKINRAALSSDPSKLTQRFWARSIVAASISVARESDPAEFEEREKQRRRLVCEGGKEGNFADVRDEI